MSISDLRNEDPRIGRTRTAVMEATMELIAAEGAEAITHQRISQMARVSRSTLYRYWPQPEDLLFEALAQIVTAFDFTGPGRLRDALTAELKRRRPEINQPLVRAAFLTVMARALHDPAAAELRDRLFGTISDALRHSVERGVAHGELRPGLEPDVLIAKVLGAIAWWSFAEAKTVTNELIEDVVAGALAGWELG
jgi:AcrR family transcriptional regulator